MIRAEEALKSGGEKEVDIRQRYLEHREYSRSGKSRAGGRDWGVTHKMWHYQHENPEGRHYAEKITSA